MCSGIYIFMLLQVCSLSCGGGFWCYFGVILNDFLAFPVLLFYYSRKDEENDTFLVCCDCLFLLCDIGA